MCAAGSLISKKFAIATRRSIHRSPRLCVKTSEIAPKLDSWMASMDFLTICIFAQEARSLEASVRACGPFSFRV
jgi:hypothetical protein